MVKVGHLVPVTIIKALPDYDSYLTMITGTELMGLLPRKYANRVFKVGDNTLAAIFQMEGIRITLSQRSPQYIRKLMELVFAPLLQEGKIQVKRAAMVSGNKFAKAAVKSLNGGDPVKQCLPYLKAAKQYTDDTITLVRYSEDIREYIANALCPAPADSIRKVIYYQSLEEADVYVDPAVVGKFLGKGGANAATAAKLTGVTINIKALSFKT